MIIVHARTSAHGHKPHPPSPPPPPPPPPLPGTLVGAAGGLQIDLQWDGSTASAPAGFQASIVSAAQHLCSIVPARNVLAVIGIGWGEVNGSPMAGSDLGQSQTRGYLTSYGTVSALLKNAQAANAPLTAPFFVPSAQAKLMGLNSPASTAVDGWIGLNPSYGFDFTGSGNGYDPAGISAHELSEVLGRIMLGGRLINSAVTYTPFDLFNFTAPSELALSSAGYCSFDNGTTALGYFNNPGNGGDLGDWGSGPVPNDAYNAFNATGILEVSPVDDQLIGKLWP